MTAVKKTTKTASVPATSSEPQIPLAVRDSKPKSAAGLLAGLAGKARVKVPKAAQTKARPVLELPPEIEAAYSEFAPAKELYDVLAARIEALKGEINPALLSAWVDILWKNKNLPENPLIQTKDEDGKVDCQGMFIVQERFKVQIPDNESPAESVVELLKQLGVVNAEELVEKEIDFSPQISLRPFNELVSGHYESKQFVPATDEEQTVGQKILEFVQNNLTEDEQALVLQNAPKTVVKKGVLQRVAGYAQSREQLAAIFQVVQPVQQNKGAKFAINDNPADKTRRLLGKAEEILGKVDLPDDEDE